MWPGAKIQGTYGSRRYDNWPSSARSCKKRNSKETMRLTRRVKIDFSSGRITWLLTYVSNRSWEYGMEIQQLTGRSGGDIILLMNGTNSNWRTGVFNKCLKSPLRRVLALLRHRDRHFRISWLARMSWRFCESCRDIARHTKCDVTSQSA